MRLWHKALIDVLPRQQLLGQNRECAAMESVLLSKGQVRNPVIGFVNDSSPCELLAYHRLVLDEFLRRGYMAGSMTTNRMEHFSHHFSCHPVMYEDIFAVKMNERYLLQCLLNLQEKFDYGRILPQEWALLTAKFSTPWIFSLEAKEVRRLTR
jgi:uncharacterized protein (TIGR02328 family)